MEESRQVNEETGIVTISSVGRCVSSDGTFWHFAGPIVGFHLLMIIGTNVLLCQVRDIADRYQEQKYVAMASALMLEILLVGVPVLVSVHDNVSATFIVFTAIIALDDIAVLCCIFGPKVNFQRKGLEQGIQFGESILRETHRRATLREFSRREMTNSQVNESLNMSGMDNKSDSEDSKKYSLGQRRETNSSRPPQSKSSGSTPAKFSGSSSLLQESIAEETSSDIRRELAPDDHSSNNWESVLSSESNQKQSVGSNPCSTSENISTHSSGGD
jgi:7 transmembrane sweet-taste receptor of 3 GCPR